LVFRVDPRTKARLDLIADAVQLPLAQILREVVESAMPDLDRPAD
jgi:predicted DNA-binding protein